MARELYENGMLGWPSGFGVLRAVAKLGIGTDIMLVRSTHVRDVFEILG